MTAHGPTGKFVGRESNPRIEIIAGITTFLDLFDTMGTLYALD